MLPHRCIWLERSLLVLCVRWKREVIVPVLTRYHATVNDLKVTVKQMEDALKKRGRGNKSKLQSGGSQLSDADKILLQLYLDVKAVGEDIKGHGIEPGDIPEFQELFAQVEPAKELLSQKSE